MSRQRTCQSAGSLARLIQRRDGVGRSVERRFYSQNGEDALLWRVFHHDSPGFFVDVSAFDGIHLSNTLSFEERG